MRAWLESYFRPRERINASPPVADEVVPTTCYMCACRCGIRVHLLDGWIRYIDGNSRHPVNRGVICGKGAAGIMNHLSPARLRAPLLRVGERGEGKFKEIGWDEALALAVSWLAPVRASDPKKLAFFTGRDQSQSLTSLWATSFGTPNWAAHGGFCSVNMAAAGQYTVGGSFWEFGEPDWEHAGYFLLFGVAEDHDSNPIKLGLSRLKARGAKIVAINPVRTGYAAIADEWLGIRPGTDGLFILALVHELLRLGRVDLDYLARLTDAGYLVVDAPGTAEDGLYARDEQGRHLVVDEATGSVMPAEAATRARLGGCAELPDGRRAMPVFALLAERYRHADHAPEAVAERCGIPVATIERIAAEIGHVAFERPVFIAQPWTDTDGREHAGFHGRPVAMHAMRGISAHANGFQTCRALHLLQLLIGSVDVPGGWRYKAPYPRPCPPGPRPFGRPEEIVPGKPLPGSPLGFPRGPEDLLLHPDGTPVRIDKAFSWDAPLAVHGMLQTVIGNAWRGDPYPVEVLFLFMANMAWNSGMNPGETMRMLADKDPATGNYRIPKFIYADAFYSETVAYADLVLPDTTYLERWDCISLLDRPIGTAHGPGDAIRQPVVKPDRDVRPFQDMLIDLGARLRLPAFAYPDGEPRYPGGYPDYLVHHERKPGIGPLAGWRGKKGDEHGRGAPNDRQLDAYIANGCFWKFDLPPEEQYFKPVNRAYLARSRELGLVDTAAPITLHLYAETLQRFRLAAEGHGAVQPPESHRERIRRHFDPLPFWYQPFEQAAFADGDFPLHAITQRPMPMYHSWGSQNAWLRQILTRNFLYMNRRTAAAQSLVDGDWVEITSPHGHTKAQLKLMDGCAADTVWTWNAIGKRAGAWSLAADAPEAERGFLMNHVIGELLPEDRGYSQANADPITGQAAWFDLRVRVTKAAAGPEPRIPALTAAPVAPPGPLAYDAGQHRLMTEYAPVQPGQKQLGLVIDLDTCVGCHACVTACKSWNTSGHPGPLADTDPYGDEPNGAWLNRVHSFEVDDGACGRTVHFPRSCLHCAEPACVTVCPTGASYKRAEDGIVLVNADLCIGCGLCAWACPYGAREQDPVQHTMKKCTLCVDRIDNQNLPEAERQPACVLACPTRARHFGDLGDPDSAVSRLVAERGGGDLLPGLGYRPTNKYLPPREPIDLVQLAQPEPPARPADRLFRWLDRALGA